MPTEADEDTKLAIQLSVIIGVALLILNVAFYFLSDLYFTEKKPVGMFADLPKADPLGATRLTFGLFTGVVSAGLVASLFQPRIVGHVLAVGFGLASEIAAIFAFRAGMPGALSVALLVLGLLFPALAWGSLSRRSRAAWSFLAALCWVLAVTMLFGAPKVRAKIDIGLWTAMIIPGLLTVAGVALTRIRGDYRDVR